MGMTLYRNILAGVRIPASKFPLPWHTDEYLPYIEGHQGVKLAMVWDHENGYVYLGYMRLHFDNVLSPEELDENNGGGFVIVPPTTTEAFDIQREIENVFGFEPSDYDNQPVTLWMIGVYM